LALIKTHPTQRSPAARSRPTPCSATTTRRDCRLLYSLSHAAWRAYTAGNRAALINRRSMHCKARTGACKFLPVYVCMVHP